MSDAKLSPANPLSTVSTPGNVGSNLVGMQSRAAESRGLWYRERLHREQEEIDDTRGDPAFAGAWLDGS